MPGYSLHIGLNRVDPARYDGWDGALSGCVNDAHSMTALAADEGFTTTTLIDDQATSQAVIGELSLLAQQACAGDICLVTYSGHGGQVDDNNGDEDDLKDETWVLYDRQVVDDELHQMWSQFVDGVRVVVVSDSCHSGTVTKHRVAVELRRSYLRTSREIGAPVVDGEALEQVASRPRSMPPLVQAADNEARRGTYQFVQALAGAKSAKQFGAGVVLLSGCQDNQLSFDGAVNGQFTGVLLQVWAGGAFSAGYRGAFHAAILAQMPSDQTPNLYTTGPVDESFLAERPFTIVGGGSTSGGSTGGARPLLRAGDRGSDVVYLQNRLLAHGHDVAPDGVFGPGTASAVRAFQSEAGVPADGVVGPNTWALLDADPTGGGLGSGGTGGGTTVATRPVIRRGMTGEHVTYLQSRLLDHGYGVVVDAVFGPGTEMVVRSFQRSSGLPADGVVGQATWSAIG